MQGFTQEFLLGRGGKYWVPFFLLATPTFSSLLLMQYYFTSGKIAPGVHGVLDKIK